MQIPLVQQLKGSVYLQWKIQWIDTAVWFYHLPLFDTSFCHRLQRFFSFLPLLCVEACKPLPVQWVQGSPQRPAFDRQKQAVGLKI